MTSKTVPARLPGRIVNVLATSAIALGLAACDKMKEPTTTGQRIDPAIGKTENAAAHAGIEARHAMAAAQTRMEAAAAMAQAAEDGANGTRSAGNPALSMAGETLPSRPRFVQG